MEEVNKLETFRSQIQDDLKLLQDNISWDSRVKVHAFTFNYWVLINIYNLDQEVAHDHITEYKDKGIDCYANHDENSEDKHLYIIQNKYYEDDTRLNSKDVSDFFTRPLASLEEGKYRNSELQSAYNLAKDDDHYTIHLHLYVTNEHKTQDITNIIKSENSQNSKIIHKVFFLSDIYDRYYGESFKNIDKFKYSLHTINKSTFIAIKPKEFGLEDNMYKTFHVVTPITDIYHLWRKAKKQKFQLFEDNIREYLGKNVKVNKKIIKTLLDKGEREKFLYYNNGITIVCDHASKGEGGDKKRMQKSIIIRRPQIVNGCQTVNSIAEVFENYKIKESDFINTYIMTKILVVDPEKDSDKKFYRDVVKYTNSQNAINEKAFGATHQPFYRIQENMREKGFFLLVKQSDKNKLKKEYKDSKKLSEQIEKAKKNIPDIGLNLDKFSDLEIQLEHLLQCIGAVKEDAHFAYTKKPQLLKQDSETYKNFSTKIQDEFTIEEMIKIICLYKRAEQDWKGNKDDASKGKFPMYFYLLNFFGFLLETKAVKKLKLLKELELKQLETLYDFVHSLPRKYFIRIEKTNSIVMIRKPIDTEVFKSVLENQFEAKREHAPEVYKEVQQILKS